MNDPTTAVRHAFVYRDGVGEGREVEVVRETPLTVYLGEREVVTLLTDGSHGDELALGFLFNEGFIDRPEQVRAVAWDSRRGEARVMAQVDEDLFAAVHGKRLVTSGCGKGSIFYHVLDAVKAGKVHVEAEPRLALEMLFHECASLAQRSETYRRSRGVHGAGLLSAEGILCFREDIGRHNALDKLAGWLLTAAPRPTAAALYSTGRLTSEVMLKAGRMAIPVVVSRAMPTELALQLAETMGITVVAGLRGRAATIFTHPRRVVVEGVS